MCRRTRPLAHDLRGSRYERYFLSPGERFYFPGERFDKKCLLPQGRARRYIMTAFFLLRNSMYASLTSAVFERLMGMSSSAI